MSTRVPTKYKTTNRSSCNAGLKQRGSLAIWFDPGMIRDAAPSGKRGRRQSRSDAAIQACLTLKVLFGLPLRQTTGFVQSLPKLVGPDWAAPDFSTLCRLQKTLNVSLPYRGGTGPLHLHVDSTGVKSEGEGEGAWNARKHPSHRNRVSTAGQWAGPNGASGAGYTLEVTRKHWKRGLSRSPAATSGMLPCCRNF